MATSVGINSRKDSLHTSTVPKCNLAAVWGQMSTGGGHTQLQETMSVLGVPVMVKSQRTDRERH